MVQNIKKIKLQNLVKDLVVLKKVVKKAGPKGSEKPKKVQSDAYKPYKPLPYIIPEGKKGMQLTMF